MLFQVWTNESEGCHEVSFSPKDSLLSKGYHVACIAYYLGFVEKPVTLVAEFEAETQLEACQKYYDAMEWGEYHPPLDADGSIASFMLEKFEE